MSTRMSRSSPDAVGALGSKRLSDGTVMVRSSQAESSAHRVGFRKIQKSPIDRVCAPLGVEPKSPFEAAIQQLLPCWWDSVRKSLLERCWITRPANHP